MFSSPTSSRISMLAPSCVPMITPPLSTAFMQPVPDASVPAMQPLREPHLAHAPDVRPPLPELRVLRKRLQPAQRLEVARPLTSHGLGDQDRQFRIRLQQPAPRRDAIRLVIEAPRKKCV